MQERLTQLTEDFNRGVRDLQTLDQRRARLRDGLLRLSGAIQALREIEAADPAGPTPDAGTEPTPALAVGATSPVAGAVDDAA